MKNLLFILSFVAMIYGGIISCATQDAVQLKKVSVTLIDTEKRSRWIDGEYKEVTFYYYLSDDKIIYRTTDYLGKVGFAMLKR